APRRRERPDSDGARAMQPALRPRVFPLLRRSAARGGVSNMTGNDRGPEWQGDDGFGPGWGNQTAHDPQQTEDHVQGEDFGRGATAGRLIRGGYGAAPGGGGFAIRDAHWPEDVEKISAHMEVGGSDGGHVGLVECLRG